jgi:rod shape determining protein RodA
VKVKRPKTKHLLTFLQHLIGPFNFKHFPWGLAVASLLLSGLGCFFITSAASSALALRHAIFAGLGVALFAIFAVIDYHHLASLAAPLYALGLTLLLFLPLLGAEINNATRWYDLGVIHLQPSEPVKISVILVLATYYSCKGASHLWRDILLPLFLCIIPSVLIIIQPDLGTAILILSLFFVMAFLAEIPWKYFLYTTAAAVIILVASWSTPGVIRDYQKQRLLSFIDPASQPNSPAAYNARQTTLAISGGGLSGQGWGRGQLTQLRRIPERHTDFIFPVIAEEWGFYRTSAVVLFYTFFLVMIGWTAVKAKDKLGELLAGGIFSLFTIQGFLHIAISLRLAPITGLTLPLVSYGGSSIVVSFVLLGIIASIMTHSTYTPLDYS